MLAAVVAVAARLEAIAVPWLVSGSTGRALLGFARRPHDVDVEVPEESIHDAARALGAVAALDEGRGSSGWRAAARVRGVEIDLFAGLTIARADGSPGLNPDFARQERFAVPCRVSGWLIRVAPVEEQVAGAIAAADWERLAKIVAGAPAEFRLRPAYLERRLAVAASAAS